MISYTLDKTGAIRTMIFPQRTDSNAPLYLESTGLAHSIPMLLLTLTQVLPKRLLFIITM